MKRRRGAGEGVESVVEAAEDMTKVEKKKVLDACTTTRVEK